MVHYTAGQLEMQALLANRASVRHFESTPIPDDVVVDIMRTTLRAPTSCNAQAYQIILARSQEDRERLSASMIESNADRIKEAPLVAVFLADLEPSRDTPYVQETFLGSGYPEAVVKMFPQIFYDLHGDSSFDPKLAETPRSSTVPTIAWSFKSVTFVAAQFMYAATAHGLGVSIFEGFNEAVLKTALEIPDRYSVPLVLVAGYQKPGTQHAPSQRKSLDKLVFHGKFGGTDPEFAPKEN